MEVSHVSVSFFVNLSGWRIMRAAAMASYQHKSVSNEPKIVYLEVASL
jgi:tRNA(Met) C34 N-acetyltransferase TmcA